jgi:hypothetical protein
LILVCTHQDNSYLPICMKCKHRQMGKRQISKSTDLSDLSNLSVVSLLNLRANFVFPWRARWRLML